MNTYDAIVVGAGHNGLTTAAYLARAGLQVLVLERRERVGGAAYSDPRAGGFTFTSCSYVCSLFRPEIIRDLGLARHGLQILPFEGAVNLGRDGDYLGMFSDHDRTRREIERHSRRDAEAYDVFAADILRQCRFIRPMLLETPPDPTIRRFRDIGDLLRLGRRFSGMGEKAMYETLRLWTSSAADYAERYFETDVLKGALGGSAIIGTGLGPYSPGTAYVLLHHFMGDVDGNIGAWGYARGGMGAISHALAGAVQEAGGEIRTGGGGHAVPLPGQARDRRRARRRRGDPRQRGGLQPRPQAHVPGADAGRGAAGRIPPPGGPVQDPRLVGQAQHRARPGAELRGHPRLGARAAQRDDHRVAGHGLPRARLRRLEARYLVARAVSRHLGALADRSDRRARRPPHDDRVRAVRAAAARRRRLDARQARRLRRHGAGDDRAARARLPRLDRRAGDTHPARARAGGRSHRGQHLPRRADPRPAAVQPPPPRVRAVPRAARALLHVRLVDASGRRRDGRARLQRGARDPPRLQAQGGGMSDSTVDAVFVGGGHNGLVAATRLARAGLRVRVLEAGAQAGGAALAREIHPASGCRRWRTSLPAFDRRALRGLGLPRHGLQAGADAATRMLLLPGGDSLGARGRPATGGAGAAPHSAADARA
ncbi:MAG: FAD-dependent oxidoreductase [Halofilum sp. (in: g-proteobacteria)]|nr:FAD-dependent oxidoreductase [Halofilum sp. (in: g-proteobacteria)]